MIQNRNGLFASLAGGMLLLAGLFSFAGTADDDRSSKQSEVRPIAHAHNDYKHKRPLQDALEQRFGSIEADVFTVNHELLVAHSVLELDRTKTLEQLYLKPLAELAKTNGGRIYPGGPSLILLVDIKSQGAMAWEILEKQLTQYREIISAWENNQWVERAVTVIVSGDRPIPQITAANPRMAGIDGRPSDQDRVDPVSLIPLISDDWTNHFQYRGVGPMPEEERTRLQDMVARVHAKGCKLRFWATPESETLWRELQEAHVDLIGTDDLPRLRSFLDR